jgi:two-component system NarL family sensor kinase
LRNIEVLKQSEQLRELSHRLIQIQDDERRHIARELHDSAGQILTALGMTLGRLAQHASSKDGSQFSKDVEEGQQLVRELSQDIRTTSYLLHPPLLDESGLSEALLWYIRGLKDRSGLDITLQIPDDFGRLSREMELVIFRIVQECLTNVHRHSGSKSAEISLFRTDENASLEVRDRGKGMSRENLTQLQSRGGGVGIRGMRERVLQLGGEMTITSEGRGTTISIILPVHKTSEPPAPEYSGIVSTDGLEWATGKQE